MRDYKYIHANLYVFILNRVNILYVNHNFFILEQDISINGAVLADSWTAVDFGLHPFCQLTLTSKFHKNNNKTSPPSSSPHEPTKSEFMENTTYKNWKGDSPPPRRRSPSPNHPPSYPPPFPPSYFLPQENANSHISNGHDEVCVIKLDFLIPV
jgi:hypothetical protein